MGVSHALKLTDLIQDAKNANKGTKRGRKLVAESLQRYGAGRSILVDRDRRIIAGNKTAANASMLDEDVILVETDGTKLVVVQRTDISLDDPKGQELAIADNRTAELGLEWDSAVMSEFAGELDVQPFFTVKELQELLPDPVVELNGDEDDASEPSAEPVTKLGDLYILGAHRLMCGDSTSPTDVDRLLAGEAPQFVFTDPPYGISVQMNQNGVACPETIMGDTTTEVAVAAYRLCTQWDIPQIWWGSNHYSNDARLPNSTCWICWDKQESNNHIDQSDCEFAWSNIKSPARIFHHLWAGFRRDSEKGERRVHPTQKPVALLIEMLDHFKADKLVLDLFGGSGSTLIACEKTKRKARLMELDPKYCDVIVTRWENSTGQKAVLHGRTKTEAHNS